MYMRLLYYANAARYKQSGGEWVFRRWIEISNKDILRDLGVPRMSMYKIRDELVAAEYIRFKPGIGAGKTEYSLCLLFDKKTPKDTVPVETETSKKPQSGSFDLNEFWDAAVKKSLGDDP